MKLCITCSGQQQQQQHLCSHDRGLYRVRHNCLPRSHLGRGSEGGRSHQQRGHMPTAHRGVRGQASRTPAVAVRAFRSVIQGWWAQGGAGGNVVLEEDCLRPEGLHCVALGFQCLELQLQQNMNSAHVMEN